ncbi:MAG: hypothetical protein ACXABY_25455 [Candidatus Thorarchaeota archaeon]|jgi:hypothetical protein
MNVTEEQLEKAEAEWVAASWAASAAWFKYRKLKREYKRGNYRVSGQRGV